VKNKQKQTLLFKTIGLFKQQNHSHVKMVIYCIYFVISLFFLLSTKKVKKSPTELDEHGKFTGH